MKQETTNRRTAEILKFLSDNPKVEGLWFSPWGGWSVTKDEKYFVVFKDRAELTGEEKQTINKTLKNK